MTTKTNKRATNTFRFNVKEVAWACITVGEANDAKNYLRGFCTQARKAKVTIGKSARTCQILGPLLAEIKTQRPNLSARAIQAYGTAIRRAVNDGARFDLNPTVTKQRQQAKQAPKPKQAKQAADTSQADANAEPTGEPVKARKGKPTIIKTHGELTAMLADTVNHILESAPEDIRSKWTEFNGQFAAELLDWVEVNKS